MKSLEVFSGKESVSNFLRSKDWDSTTIDICDRFQPTICSDILNVTKEMLPKNLDFMWFSPVCRLLSRAANSHHWQKIIISYRVYKYIPVTSDARNTLLLLNKISEIISWYPGVKFVIENPIGRIQHMQIIKDLGHYRYAVNYADFGFNYSKETYLFTNFLLPFSAKKVSSSLPGLQSVNSHIQRSCVPVGLIEKIYHYL